MIKITFIWFILLVTFASTFGITTIHHDKPQNTQISMVTKMQDIPNKTAQNFNIERQKRLLPYINFYRSRKPSDNIETEQITPFLESNALPGPFVPIQREKAYTSQSNFQEIYDKLVLLKQNQPVNYYQPETTITTYAPTQINVSEERQKSFKSLPTPLKNYNKNIIYRIVNPNYNKNEKKPVYFYQTHEEAVEKPITYTLQPKRLVNTIIDDKYIAQKFVSNDHIRHYQPIPLKQYETVRFTQEPTPPPPIENTNSMSQLLKQLQDTNTLPQTLTPENIDNSIKTLVNILNNLKKNLPQKFSVKPIVVADDENVDEIEEKPEYDSGITSQTFPANTIEGGTPGRPGIDYPALSTIPPTSFNCKTQRYKGFFGDPNTNCQVWHYCDLNGGQASFLCPNGTIFSQVALTCDWWYNVKCDNTAQLYVLNERLYKYILPLSPKFPEDYSGPLVDKYLALKFKEMEEKVKKEKEPEESEEEKDDSDQLQDINQSKNEKNKE